MQQVWISKIDWDDPLSPQIQSTWDSFRRELSSINDIQIPRPITSHSANIVIHGFADASNIAYGACVYSRSIGSNGEIVVRLITSKSRVAPLSTTSIPRLELNAAVLLANLVKKVNVSLNINDKNCILWSDSSIVLCWLRMSPHQLKTYVANRVSEIQDITSKMSWRHVDSKNNSADILSRGCLPAEFSKCDQWFNGPAFLKTAEENWPSKFVTPKSVPETKENVSSFVISKARKIQRLIDYERYSSITKIVRIIAWCNRFISNCKIRQRDHRRMDKLLHVEEISKANICLMRNVQNELFYDELNVLMSKKQLHEKNQLIRLTPFVDSDDLIRVGGRLEQCNNLSYEQKHQILLGSHYITNLLIRETHLSNLHSGIQQTHATLRQNYWIINGKRLITSIIQSCIPCVRIQPKLLSQLMGNLPADRVEGVHPFEVSGVDFCGPFSVRYKNQRKETYAKVYVCIFVCLWSKAVHLEVVEDASADTFIGCLKRFFGRRGLSKLIYSDNGSNFVGAYNKLKYLKEMFDRDGSQIVQFCASKNVQWKFIPPRSPHFGGIWESGVKVLKTHMKKVVGDQIMTLEFLYTLAVEIEAIMNSRPLTQLSTDPNDLQVLTPGHILIGRELNSIPEPQIKKIPANRLLQWQKLTQMAQLYRKRFQYEYINTLQQRSKWIKQQKNINLNELVLVRDESLPTTHWLIGRVIEVIKGTDGLVRCVVIRTKSGNIKRAITNIARLPIETSAIDNP